MLSIKNISAIILLLLAAPRTFGQELLTLQQVLQQIEQNNPALRAYDSRVKSQDTKVEGAGSWMAPMVGAGTFMTPYKGSEAVSEMDRGAWMFAAEQDIPNPSKTRAKSAYLQSQSAIEVAGREAAANELRAAGKALTSLRCSVQL